MLHLCFLKKTTAFSMRDTKRSYSHERQLSSNKHSQWEKTHLLHANAMTSGSKLSASYCVPVLINESLKGYGGLSLHSITTLRIHIIHCVWNVFIHLLSLQQAAFPLGYFISFFFLPFLFFSFSLFLNTCSGFMAVGDWPLTVCQKGKEIRIWQIDGQLVGVNGQISAVWVMDGNFLYCCDETRH